MKYIKSSVKIIIIFIIIFICLGNLINSTKVDIYKTKEQNNLSYTTNLTNIQPKTFIATDEQLENIYQILKSNKYKDFLESELDDEYLKDKNNWTKIKGKIKQLSGYSKGADDSTIDDTEYDIVATYLFYRYEALNLVDELQDREYLSNEYENIKQEDSLRKDGSAFLNYARKVKSRIEKLGLIYRISRKCNYNGYEKFAVRALKEMEYICSEEKNWLATSFLGTSEMAYSIGLGYNWFLDEMPENIKNQIEIAIIKNALNPFCLYAKNDEYTNVTEVTYSGIGVAALSVLNSQYNISIKKVTKSYKEYYEIITEDFTIKDEDGIIKNINNIYDEEILSIINNDILKDKENKDCITSQEFCLAIVNKIINKIPTILNNVYDENGIYKEGAMYWNYGTSYINYFLSSFYNTMGRKPIEEKFNKISNIDKMILYPIYISNNNYVEKGQDKVFDYSDSQADLTCSLTDDMWFANIYADLSNNNEATNALYYFKSKMAGHNYGLYNLLWYNPKFDTKQNNLESVVNNTFYNNTSENCTAITFRNNYEDKNSLFVGLKSGYNNNNHAHIDIGSFVFDALGTRWIEDPAHANYSSKNYDNGYPYEYQYYLKRAESHSTIIINPEDNNKVQGKGYAEPDQYIYANGKLNKLINNDSSSMAILDVSSAYNREKNGEEDSNSNENKITRGIKLFDSKKYMILQDEINLKEEGEIYSFLNLNSDKISNIEIKDNKAVILTDNNNNRLKLQLISDNENAKFELIDKKSIYDYLNNENENFTYTSNLAYNNEDEYYKKIAVHLKNTKDVVISIAFIPIYEENDLDKDITSYRLMKYWDKNYEIGDINGDKEIDSRDTLRILEHIAATTIPKIKLKHPEWVLENNKFQAADINEDGIIDSRDTLRELEYIAATTIEKIGEKHPDWIKYIKLKWTT